MRYVVSQLDYQKSITSILPLVSHRSAAARAASVAQVEMVFAAISTAFPVPFLIFPGCALVPPVSRLTFMKLSLTFGIDVRCCRGDIATRFCIPGGP